MSLPRRLWDYDLPFSIGLDQLMEDKGVVAVYAYHCHRCGYIWLPKDYDVSDENALHREPPKSCARCKSKSWKDIRMQRISKSAHVDEDGWIEEPTSIARFDALIRQGESLKAISLRPEYAEVITKTRKELFE
jgi:hypothetical protein